MFSLREVLCREWLSKEYLVIGPAGAHGGVLMGVMAGILGAEGGDKFREWRSGLKGVAGVSIGSLCAVAIAMGVDLQRLRYLINNFPFGEIFSEDGRAILDDVRWRELLEGKFGSGRSMSGIMSGASLYAASDYVLAACGVRSDVTFAELYEASGGFDLRIIATDLTSLKAVVFNNENTPDTTLVSAMAASMCIPVMFRPIRVKGNGFFRKFTCVDGAISDPFGLCAFPEQLAKNNVLIIAKNVNLTANHRHRTITSILQSTLIMATQANLNVARLPFQNMVFGIVGAATGKDETEVASWAQLLDKPETNEFFVDGIMSVDNMVLTHIMFALAYILSTTAKA